MPVVTAFSFPGCVFVYTKTQSISHFLLNLLQIKIYCNQKGGLWDKHTKSVLLIFHGLLPIMRVTSTNLISLDSLKSVCIKVILWIIIHHACGPCYTMCFSLFMVTSIYSINQKLGNKTYVERIKRVLLKNLFH